MAEDLAPASERSAGNLKRTSPPNCDWEEVFSRLDPKVCKRIFIECTCGSTFITTNFAKRGVIFYRRVRPQTVLGLIPVGRNSLFWLKQWLKSGLVLQNVENHKRKIYVIYICYCADQYSSCGYCNTYGTNIQWCWSCCSIGLMKTRLCLLLKRFRKKFLKSLSSNNIPFTFQFKPGLFLGPDPDKIILDTKHCLLVMR